jgi:D-xylose 1-dehydrogenase
VAFVDIQDGPGKTLAAELGALFIPCDITDTDALVTAINATCDQLGPISVLVNNAANDDRRAIDDVSPDYWDRQMNVNLKPQFFASQAVRPQMKALGGGSIINFSSISWRYGADAMSVYATAKSGTIGLSMALARGFGEDRIRVNSIEPGAVMTERQRQLWYKDPADVDRMVNQQILKQVLTGDHIARTVLFLASDDAEMITKQTFIVDAGMR